MKTAADLVADRRLLKVALAAFGLEGEIDKKALIRKVLEEGTGEGAIATRMTDPAWRRIATAFGFDGAARDRLGRASRPASSPPTRPAPSRPRSARPTTTCGWR